MVRRCRLCKNPAVGDSMFCDQHRSQAQLFSVSFGKTGPDERAAAEAEEPLDEREAARAERRAARAAEQDTDRGPVPKLKPRTSPPEKQGADNLVGDKLLHAFERIRDRARSPSKRDALRWPQISLYCLHDRVHARPYYTIIPGGADEQKPETGAFAVTDTAVEEAIAPEGSVFNELVSHFEDCMESLKNRWLQSVDLHFLTYAGLIAINEHLPTQEERNLVTFKLDDGAFVAVEASEVKDLLRHERW